MDEPKQSGNDEKSVVSTRRMETIVAAIVFLFGALFLYQSYKLGFHWAVEGPQSGFFPFYVALIICCSSAFVLIGSVRRAKDDGGSFVDRGQLRKVLAVLIPAALYVLSIQLIGIYVASAIYVALFMRFMGKYGWIRSVVIAGVICVLFFFMFEVWFEVPLYKGSYDVLGWTGY